MNTVLHPINDFAEHVYDDNYTTSNVSQVILQDNDLLQRVDDVGDTTKVLAVQPTGFFPGEEKLLQTIQNLLEQLSKAHKELEICYRSYYNEAI